jgi:hypothetical protein
MAGDEEVLFRFEREQREADERVRRVIAECGGESALADHDERIRLIRNGQAGAWAVWHSISDAQRRALEAAGRHKQLAREPGSRTFFGARGGLGDAERRVARLGTIRNLIARGLLACEGGAYDPEAVVLITERGRFVLKHGPEKAGKDGWRR